MDQTTPVQPAPSAREPWERPALEAIPAAGATGSGLDPAFGEGVPTGYGPYVGDGS